MVIQLIINQVSRTNKSYVSNLSKKPLHGYSILPLMMQEKLVLGAWTVMQNSVLRS